MIAPSDRTLAELLEHRLRALNLFELFARALGPSAVFVSARGFDDDGFVYRVSGEAHDLETALVALFKACSLARLRCRRPLVPHENKTLPKKQRWRPDPPQRESSAPKRPHAERVALERATRIGSISPQSLSLVLGGDFSGGRQGAVERARAVLERLVDTGELERPRGVEVYTPARRPRDAG